MVVPLRFEFTTTLVTPRVCRQISNRVNRKVGDYVVQHVLPSKFGDSIRYDIPHVFQRRGIKYEQRKLRLLGHTKPWVFTGQSKRDIPASARVTATASGGRVIIRAPWAAAGKKSSGGGIKKSGFRVQQLAELEALGKRQLDRMARYAEKLWQEELNNPANLRKRRDRGSGG